jgi:hypothetical protein
VSRQTPLPEQVRDFLEGVAAKLPAEDADRLRDDIGVALASQDGDFLNVDLPGYQRPTYEGHRNLPYEGKLQALDGGPMSLLVNIDQNERLLAIEFIRWGSPNDVEPDWSTLSIVEEPPAF